MNDFARDGHGLISAAQRLIRVSHSADVGEARRQGNDLASLLGFGATPAGQLALAITEAANNIVKHARDGAVLMRPLQRSNVSGLEVLALDKGQGMRNLAECMRDGYSSAGSPGSGLGALQRVTSAFQIYTASGKGTALRFEVWAQMPAAEPADALLTGAVCIAKAGEKACGDAWTVLEHQGRTTLLVVDGLGHGMNAAIAAHAAVDLTLRRGRGLSAVELIDCLHAGLRSTRGAAGAVAVLDCASQSGQFCGIGNISCTIRHPRETRRLVSHNGILGQQRPRMQEFGFAFPADATLIAHSDGLNTRWQLDAYPGLEHLHPALLAGVLFRDHERGRDDATVVVLRRQRGTEH